MTLYRINYTGDTKLNRYTEMLIEHGQLVEVEPVDIRVMCDDCHGVGYLGNTRTARGCGACRSFGFKRVRVVVVEDTE